MKRNDESYYSEIESFEDLKAEKSRLLLRSKLLECRITMNIEGIKETFSLSALALSMAKEMLLPKIADILGIFIKETGKEEGGEAKTE